MDRGQDAGADQEGAKEAQREGKDRQQDRPSLKGAALFSGRQGVEESGCHQPRHKRGVFNRIPKPPATPAQFVIGPPGSEHDTEGQKNPGNQRPRPRPPGPGGIEGAPEEGGNRKTEGNGKSHIAHVQHWRMDGHAEILQQRIEVVAIGRHRHQTIEGVRGQQDK